jgi:hypothetical protein
MSPEVYMCYIISTKSENFKQLIRRWNSEFGGYSDKSGFRVWKNKMITIRRKHKTNDWSNFNVRKLFDFINEHIYWEK